MDCAVRRFTSIETQQYIREKIGVDITTDYLRHLKMSLRRDSQKQLRSYQIDRFEYANAMVFKRIAELENNQDILHRIIENNKGNPEVQVKAVAQLNETIMLISDLFEMLPQISNLGMDAFSSSFDDSNKLVNSESKINQSTNPEWQV
jgi:hypothetical protein